MWSRVATEYSAIDPSPMAFSPVSTLGEQLIRLLQLSHHLLWGVPLASSCGHPSSLPARHYGP
jgi:hypothetical protein